MRRKAEPREEGNDYSAGFQYAGSGREPTGYNRQPLEAGKGMEAGFSREPPLRSSLEDTLILT